MTQRQQTQQQQQPYSYSTQQPGAAYQPYAAYGYPAVPYQSGAGLQVPMMPSQQAATQNIPGMLPIEESYIENILRLNRGKVATVYMTFENNREWNAKIFKGEIEAAGRDHIILMDRQTGTRYLLLMVYLDYITFDERINYNIQNVLTSQPPR